ncbi:hypothetical protein AB1L88_04115 [Tautonia sp. JC769]|uniref:hypothetical protein n=1 Tax=Tautonia sp. JC769 TaxID=3232135 RepID=UPI00345957FC
MPDADWVRYRSLRGQALPDSATLLGGEAYALEKTLKSDFYAVTGLYRRVADDSPNPAQILLKIYHTDPWWLPPLSLLGRYLAHRERHYLRRLAGVDGVPAFLESFGPNGLVREYLDGVNLREFFRGQRRRVDADYFPRLFRILDAIHRRGVSHNDLSKPENVLVLPDGSPAIIDLQIALELFPRWLGRPIVSYLQRVDRYHLRKLHRRQRPEDFTDAELSSARRKGAILILHSLVRRPYRAVRHFILGRFLTDRAAPPPASSIPKAYMFRDPSAQPGHPPRRPTSARSRP